MKKMLVSILCVVAAGAVSAFTNAIPDYVQTNVPPTRTVVRNYKTTDYATMALPGSALDLSIQANVAATNIPAPGCTDNGASMSLVITGMPPTVAWRCAPTGTLAMSIAPNAPAYRYTVVSLTNQPVTFASQFVLVATNATTNVNFYAIEPWTGSTWRVTGGGVTQFTVAQ